MEKHFTIEQVKSALRGIRGKISDAQMSMLKAHYLCRIASMETIAKSGRYREYRAGNLQYGTLCRRIARRLGFRPPHEWTYTIATPIQERDAKGHAQWEMDRVVRRALEAIEWVSPVSDEVASEEAADEGNDYGDVTKTERKALNKARIGQGVFRTRVVDLWGSCAVTGCSLNEILVASHIVPWTLATNKERLDPFNGLLLTPNFDKLFDQCLISFKDDGSILLSKALLPEARAALGINKKSRLRFVRLASLPFLQRHRRLFLERD
jgi:hypothetical protein